MGESDSQTCIAGRHAGQINLTWILESPGFSPGEYVNASFRV